MIRTLDTHPRRVCEHPQRATRFWYGDEQGVSSRNVLFVAVALLGTAHGFIHRSPRPENLFKRQKVLKISNWSVQIQSAWKYLTG